MVIQDISFESPQDNIVYDEVLLQLAEDGLGSEILRFWESNSVFVVLGRIGKEKDDLIYEQIKNDQIPVLRRSSGGGTVLQGKGCLNYTLILSKDRVPQLQDIKGSYEYILGKVIEALNRLGVDAEFKPTSDLALRADYKKFSGNAQKRGKKYILHHGTILYDFALEKIAQYLKYPKETPEYRGGRPHQEFVTNINIVPVELKRAFQLVFNIGTESNSLSRIQHEKLKEFAQGKKALVHVV